MGKKEWGELMPNTFEQSRPFFCPLGKYCKVWQVLSRPGDRTGCTFGTDQNLKMRNTQCQMPVEIIISNLIQQVKICPECNSALVPDSDYPNDLLCVGCSKVFDAKTLKFVEAF